MESAYNWRLAPGGAFRMDGIDWAKLAREAEQGRRVLMYLNRLELRKQEDRAYVATVKRIGRELLESARAKGQAA